MTYSLDLRKRIVAAVENGLGTISQIARWFGVHESFIYKLSRQKRERQDIAPLPHGGGAVPRLSEDHLMTLTDLVAATPDAILAELGAQLQRKTGVAVSVSTIHRALVTLGISRKKKTVSAAEADPVERAEFREKQALLPLEDLLFLDEFASNIALTRTHARAPIGERATTTEPFRRGQNQSTIAALGLAGIVAPMTIEGALNSEVFELYVAEMLVPHLRPGHILVLDNVRFHHSIEVVKIIEGTGARVLYLPPYSPDLNPIEECISKIKETLRGLKARTKRKLYRALGEAISRVTTADISGWFKHCGYTYTSSLN